jgi:hypothetical protein
MNSLTSQLAQAHIDDLLRQACRARVGTPRRRARIHIRRTTR